jgi:GDPmannose 4,6-dehydratase
MWLILQQDDRMTSLSLLVYSILFVSYHSAFANDGIEIEWKGEGIDEKGYDKATVRWSFA